MRHRRGDRATVASSSARRSPRPKIACEAAIDRPRLVCAVQHGGELLGQRLLRAALLRALGHGPFHLLDLRAAAQAEDAQQLAGIGIGAFRKNW